MPKNKDEELGPLEKISQLLERALEIQEEDRKRVMTDHKRAVDNYERLRNQHTSMLHELPYSEECKLESELNKAILAINDANKQLNESNKAFVPVIGALTKIITTNIQAETMKEIGGGFNNGQKRINAPVDLNKLLTED